MTRYLSPSKVALLCLVSVYTEGVVPHSATIPVLSFLVSHLLPLDPAKPALHTFQRHRHHVIPMEEFEKAVGPQGSSIPGRSVWDLFLKKMWSLDCCDALEVFFSDISGVLMKSREEQIRDRDAGIAPETGRMLLSRSSPLGAFVRRAQLEFTRLQFHDAVALWRNFIKYRMPTYNSWARKEPSGSGFTVDSNLADLGLDPTSTLSQVVYGNIEDGSDDEGGLSTKDLERLLEFQIGELQRVGGRVPDDMKARLEHMVASGSTVPSLSHYLGFLDAWRAGDYPSSFDKLHRYFDYTMQNRDRTFYQYALLNLAIVQADFGCHAEAVSAIQESIAIARETHDMNCLNFCMSWLYHFGKAFPNEMKDVQNTGMLGSEKEGLAFLKAKAKETEMWSLLSTSLLSEVKLDLQNGDSIAAAFENITRASHLNVIKNVTNSIGPQIILQAAVFSRLGVNHLSWTNYEVFRHCYADLAPTDDLLKATCGSCQLLAQQGQHEKALECMNAISPEVFRTLKHYQHWTFFTGLIKFRRLLYRDDKVSAEHLAAQLQGSCPGEAELHEALSFLVIELLMRKGDYTVALDKIDEVAQANSHGTFDVQAQVKLMILKARVFDKTGQPQRGFSLAMRAASSAHRARILPALWDAIGALATVLISLREFEAALEMLESIVPQVLECEDCELTARTFSLLVDVNMGQAGQAEDDASRRKEHMVHALEYIDCAFEAYSAIDDLRGQCETMAKKATIMHLSGDLVLANDYAAKYLDLKNQAAAERES